MDFISVIKKAIANIPEKAKSDNKAKSRWLLLSIAREFESHPPKVDGGRVVVFSKELKAQSKTHPGEMMFDIHVCRIKEFNSPRSHSVECAVEALWQVESELLSDASGQLYDFGKLLTGNAPYKAFITSLPRNEGDQDASRLMFRNAYLASTSLKCDKEMHLIYVPRPVKWRKECDPKILHFRFNSGDWQKAGKA